MHYSNLVIIEKPEEITQAAIEAAVEEAMGPSQEQGGFWDWYQIGGRWSGALDGYNPDEDPANLRECDLCNGTGKREDALGKEERARNPDYNCNGCDGRGKSVAWPTSWAFHPGDVAPVSQLTEAQLKRFYRVVTPGHRFEAEDYVPWAEIGKMFPKKEMPPLAWLQKEYADYFVVVVDNHS